MIPSTIGAFGRQARYRHGPLPVLRTAHPATGDFLQLPSAGHKHNLLQYQFTHHVQSVKVDRQLPLWVDAYLTRCARAAAQLVVLKGGASLILRLNRNGKEGVAPRFEQLNHYLWRVERSTHEVEQTTLLNRNLEGLGQLLSTGYEKSLVKETTAVVSVLKSCGVATSRDLKAYMYQLLRTTAQDVDVTVARLLISHQISADLRSQRWSDSTELRWGNSGGDFLAPIPHLAISLEVEQ